MNAEKENLVENNKSTTEVMDAKSQEKYFAEKNYKEAIHWYHRAAAQGNSDAQFLLGHYYYYKKYNLLKANYWYTKAAEQGNIQAQLTLGFMYYSNVGVTTNYSKAFK